MNERWLSSDTGFGAAGSHGAAGLLAGVSGLSFGSRTMKSSFRRSMNFGCVADNSSTGNENRVT
jgi:hypothetical protein